jgi:hypothetical protein
MKLQRIPGVCEVYQTGAPRHGKRLLIEIPHGATERLHFDALASRLSGVYPAGLEKFFFVNTDLAAPELASAIAASPAMEGVQVTVVRSLIPRTFIDCNRVTQASPDLYRQGKVTPATADYVQHSGDIELLHGLLADYEKIARRAYEAVCGEGGVALMLHTYAPRTVPIQAIGSDIVEQLRFHYAPGKIESCELRPEIDFIHKTPDGTQLVDPAAMHMLSDELEAAGFQVSDGVSYPLHPSTAAFHHAQKFKGRTICVEVRRDLLVQEWLPFEPMEASPERLAPVAGAFARGVASWLDFHSN